jgi:hypothetical protein
MSPRPRRRAGQEGQATLEYIFMLLAAVGFFMILFNLFLKPLGQKFYNYISNRFNQVLTNGDLHTLPFKPPAN